MSHAARYLADAKAAYRAGDFKTAAGLAFRSNFWGPSPAAAKLEQMALIAIHGSAEALAAHLEMCDEAGE